ncbi:MAG: hypothetical protein ACO1NY_14460 [Pseudorhodoplanes sp.]
MSPPEQAASRAPNNGPARRIATAFVLGLLIFGVMWIMAFSLITSLAIGAGCCVVTIAASSVSDLVEMLLDAIASVIFGVLAAIAGVFAAILALFGF